jgi:hypothetical protein
MTDAVNPAPMTNIIDHAVNPTLMGSIPITTTERANPPYVPASGVNPILPPDPTSPIAATLTIPVEVHTAVAQTNDLAALTITEIKAINILSPVVAKDVDLMALTTTPTIRTRSLSSPSSNTVPNNTSPPLRWQASRQPIHPPTRHP